MPQLVEATPEDEILTHDLRDRDPISTWGKGAMTLLGDAAHPMVPFMGQGGCQALEDSIALGAAMKEAPNVEAGLRQYETMRKARTAEFVKQSRRAQSSSMTSSPIICGLRDFILPKLPVNLLLKTFHTLNSYEQPDL
jgi:2-polyprenyl-6-methoxyphenol hydroxylase-like FAD-dependent oxidoreductase